MRMAFPILRGTGRGTSRRLVEGALRLAPAPLHHAALRRGPPPRAGEEL